MATSVHGKIVAAAITTIQGLNLTGIASANVVELLSDQTLANLSFPSVVVAKNGTEQMTGGTNLSDDIAYPVVVFVMDRQAPEDVSKSDTWTLWRELIRNAFISQRLSGVTSSDGKELVNFCAWEPGAILDPSALKAAEYQHMKGIETFRFRTRELRGANH